MTEFVVAVEDGIGISDEISAKLTDAEKNFLNRFYDWLRNNWTLTEVEIGFPSGVKVTFKRRLTERHEH